jgi:hypothetical protein
MSIPKNIPLFGFEIFKEIELNLEQMKNIFPYSNNNDSYNAVVKLCIERVREMAESKRTEMENKEWD